MSFRWLKPYLPRNLYGRAILILLLPVVTVLLVVSFVFIQRHFEGVTEQMTRTVSRELVLLLDVVEDSGKGRIGKERLTRLSDALDYHVEVGAVLPSGNQRRWYDFSGLVVIRTMNDLVPAI